MLALLVLACDEPCRSPGGWSASGSLPAKPGGWQGGRHVPATSSRELYEQGINGIWVVEAA